ncbi:helix-turn-helix domain-containing protein [Bradyrhizobium elkanii]|uniref:Transcriptional regulator with XRE-family HTH domain n=1 Tax=Bradyrhizobium elkanii TaxID=29448 RepID=A0A8I2C8Q8_BRAEL|nr:hypothetical protein [Bradyrhizobium elkanii]MBP1296646.1 transcriptional regulator with XRE-family HTH domain [Bradyrhizobium elkanii]
MEPVNRSKAKREVQTRQRVWLQGVLEAQGLKPAQLAKGAGASTSTLTRFLNDEDYTGTLTAETIERIKRTYDVPGPDEAERFDPLLEARRLAPEDMPAAQRAALAALTAGRKGVEAWTIHGAALQGVGVSPGDVMLVDLVEVPRAGDIVCAEIHEQGTRRVVFRIYEKPYLVAVGFDPRSRVPIVVDDRNVIVRGVVTDRLASRRG